MKPDIAAAIRDLLFEHDEVVIPGLGAFQATYQPATVDHVQGHLMPPSRKITFDSQLTIDDGRLTAWLIERYGLSASEAAEALQQYISEVKDRFAQKEGWELPRLGKLYRDYEGNYRFEQRASTFSVTAFGLPEFDAQPVVAAAPKPAVTPRAETEKRHQPIGASTASHPVERAAPAAASKSESAPLAERDEPLAWLYKLVPALLVSALFVVLLSFYLIYFHDRPRTPLSGAQMPSAPSPSRVEDEAEDVADFEFEEDEESPLEEVAPPDLQETFVVLHSFGQARNATRFAERLIHAGYNAASVQDGRLIRVGVRLSWRDSSELKATLQTLEQQYRTKPLVWEMPFEH